MGLNTKIKIDDQHVEQISGTTLTFNSGSTTQYNAHPTFTGDTQVVDKKYVDDNVVSASTYNLGSPAAVDVGGIEVDYVLTGKSTNCIIQDMLYPTLFPSFTVPTTQSVVLTPGTSPLEIGTVIATLCVVTTINKGSIDPQYTSASPYRGGPANSYCFTGTDIVGSYACTADSAQQNVTSALIAAGANTWGGCVSYDAGVQPKDNKDNDYDSPLGAGITGAKSDSITGILPYFYGVSATPPVADCTLISGGSKCVATSTSTLPIVYGVQTSKYLWFATPFASQTKLGWWETLSNKGNIGTPSDLFDAPTTVAVDSPDGCWTAESYKIYVTNYAYALTTANAYCMTNAAQQ